jgi:FixJ family two-component response regulator
MSLVDSPSLAFMVQVVVDDASVHHSVSFLLESYGFSVRTYQSGAELLAAGVRGHGCLVLDFHVPEMDGLRVLRQLRAERINLPTILITAGADPAIERRAAKAGVFAVVAKPFAADDLIEAIASTFASHRR